MIANLEFKKTNFKDKIISVLQSDVRIVQILLMGTLLSIGVYFRDFSIHPMQIFLTFCSGLATHFLWNRILKIKVAILSTVITCFGLSLLLRSDLFWIHPAIVFLAISSKFIIRIRGKHLFNPAMFGVILGISLFPRTWVSPGQWGFELTIGIWLLVFGLIVSGRAGISDISYAFLLFHFLFLAYRIFRFGYQWDVLLHQFQNGALILFAFFMITDPKTIPDHKIGRILHAFLVAMFSYIWAFVFFKTNPYIWALFISSPVVIFWDYLLKAEKYKWKLEN